MQDKLVNAVIQLSSKEEKLGKFGPMMKLKDEKGLTYTVYKNKKDGSVSVAWEQLQTLNLGDMVQVSFAEQTGDYEGKSVTYRTVRAFNLDIGNGVANSSAQEKSSNSEAPRASGRVLISEPNGSYEARNEAFGRRLGIQGHINALLSNPNYYDSEGPSISDLVKEAIAIEDEAEKQINPSKFRQAVQDKAPQVVEDELPVIQVENDGIDVESIPF